MSQPAVIILTVLVASLPALAQSATRKVAAPAQTIFQEFLTVSRTDSQTLPALSQTLPAAAQNPSQEPRVCICLNGNWLRAPGGDGAKAPEEGWQTVRVPEFHADALSGAAWFRLDFAIPAELAHESGRMLLEFTRVRHYARVILNGRICGESFGCRAPFELDVTDSVRLGWTNRLEVWVHDCSGDFAMKGKSLGDADMETLKRLSTFTGYRDKATIAEDVCLVFRPALYVSDVLVTPSVRKKTLHVRVAVRNETAGPVKVKVDNRVFLGEKQVLTLPQTELQIGPGEEESAEVACPWTNPQHWGFPPYGTPVLYHLETKVAAAGQAGRPDRLVTRFGFREIWTEGEKILFNGRPLRLLGYWQPEASGRTVWTLRMASVQALGCNTVHNHAEQREPAFYDVADEMGLLVWDANFCGGPLGTSMTMDGSSPFPEVEAELTRQYPQWAKSVANHPSAAVMMVGCLIDPRISKRLAEVFRKVNPAPLLMGNGQFAEQVFDLGAFCCKLSPMEEDMLAELRRNCEFAKDRCGKRPDGGRVPVVLSECWYDVWRQDEKTGKGISADPVRTAEATAQALALLGPTAVSGLNLYSQVCYQKADGRKVQISWPSRSGRGQHATSMTTGGPTYGQPEYANLADPSQPAFTPTPAGQALARGAKAFWGHEMTVARTRRPEILVTATRGGQPAADAYVYVLPAGAPPANCQGMRTDGNGTAWLELGEPGVYRVFCRQADGWKTTEVKADCQPLDLSKGGMGPLQRVSLSLRSQDDAPAHVE